MDKVLGDMSRFLKDSIPHTGLLLSDLTHFLNDFLHSMRTGSLFHLQHETKPGFFKLTMTRRQHKWVQVEFGLPEEDWSRNQFDQVREAMLQAGHTTYVEEKSDNNQLRRYLRVYVQGNWNELTPTLIQVLELAAKQLGYEASDRYSLRGAGIANFDYMHERSTQIDEKIKRSRLGRGCVGRLMSAVFFGVAKLFDDEDQSQKR